MWDEFSRDRERLVSVAEAIRSAADIVRESEKQGWLAEDEFPEGQILTRLHILRERNRSSIQAAILQAAGRLKCVICDFDFRSRYGRWGEQYIECHDTVSISEVRRRSKPDLVMVCSNCHRMVHRVRPWLDRSQLRSIVI